MPETADILLKNHPDNWAWEKIKSGRRITYEEGVRLIKEGDLTALGIMADYIRRKRWGNKSLAESPE